MNVREYLDEHSAVEIKVGKSGADVYEIDGRYVLKHVVRQKLKNEQYESYVREALFYRDETACQRAYLPKVLKAEISEDEILILMKKYGRLRRNTINTELLSKITRALAGLHTDETPAFLGRDREKAKTLSGQRIAECLDGWKSVLAEHPGVFDGSRLEEIADGINELIEWHDSEECGPVHGDFHWDNLLEDENGNILICDWQGVGLGGASGDLSFFLSRLSGDGIRIDSVAFLDSYVNAVRELSGKRIRQEDIMRHMDAANVITSFVFWHEYLHGSSEKRVRDIYGRMISIVSGLPVCRA